MIYLTFMPGTGTAPRPLHIGPFYTAELMSTALLASAHEGRGRDVIAALDNEENWRLVTHDWPTLEPYDGWLFSEVVIRTTKLPITGKHVDPRYDLDRA